MSTPRTIHASEENVAVKGGSKTDIFVNRSVDRVRPELLGSRSLLQVLCQQIRFYSPHVVASRVEQPIEIAYFDQIEVNDTYILKSHARERFGNKPADASGTDDPDA